MRTPNHLRHAAAGALALATVATLAAPARAQRVEAPLVLRLPTSTRTLAMGGGQPIAQDAESPLANPGLLGWARGASAQGERYGAASTLGTLATAMPMLAGTVGIGVRYLDYGAPARGLAAIDRAAPGALGARGPLAASSLAASLGYGRRMLGLRTGVALKYVEERLGSARDGTAAVDVGVAASAFSDNMIVGLGVQDIGHGLQLAGARAPLPTRVTLGLSGETYPLRTWLDVGASASLSVLRGGDVVGGGGVEAALIPLDGYAISGRVGARRTLAPGEGTMTAGLGLTRDRVSLDYAYEPFAGRDGHRVGVRIR